jgi:uncharacterized delta-60 repeat protein
VGGGKPQRSCTVLASALALFHVGCLPTPVFDCEEHEDCAGLGEDARCEWVGSCSVPAEACTSGRRFHEFAGEGRADTCIESGQEIWTQTYASPGFVLDRAYAIAIDSKGSAAIIGHSTVAGQGYNLWVRKYTTDGDDEWTWVKDGDANGNDEGWSIVVDENDDFIIGGYLTTLTEGENGFIAKLSTDGFRIWDTQFDGGRQRIDQVRGVRLAADGDIVAVGYATIDDLLETELWYQRRSGDGQQVRWTKTRMGVAANSQDRGHALTPVGDDFVGVGFRQEEDYTAIPWMTRFDADGGNDVWSEEDPLPADGSGGWTTVNTLPNGELLLVGWRDRVPGDPDIWLQRRSPAGEVLWDELVASPGGAEDRGNAIGVAPDGSFAVGGELGAGAGSTDAWLRRYAADGTARWEDTISGPAGSRDTVWGLAFDPDGNLWACGYIADPETDWDVWVRKYTP